LPLLEWPKVDRIYGLCPLVLTVGICKSLDVTAQRFGCMVFGHIEL
jgi:hypothetical protein